MFVQQHAVCHRPRSKMVLPVLPSGDLCHVYSTDTIVAPHTNEAAVFPGKGVLCATFAHNVFEYLKRTTDVPLAFVGQHSPDTLVEQYCDMIQLEIVCRFRSTPDGSYVQRYPGLAHGGLFLSPVEEFFIDTPDQRLGDRLMPFMNPFIGYDPESETGEFHFYRPDEELAKQVPAGTVTPADFGITLAEWRQIAAWSREAAYSFEVALKLANVTLFDVIFRFGRTKAGAIVLVDWIDPDCSRIAFVGLKETADMGKQLFGMGVAQHVILARYQRLAELSESF